MNYFDRVRTRLPANFEGNGGNAIEPRDRALFFRAIFHAANIPNFHWSAIDVGDHQLLHLARIGVASEGAQNQFALSRLDISARNICVLTLQSVAHLSNRNLVSGQPFGVDPNIDRAIETAHNVDFANSAGAFDLNPNNFVRIFG